MIMLAISTVHHCRWFHHDLTLVADLNMNFPPQKIARIIHSTFARGMQEMVIAESIARRCLSFVQNHASSVERLL